MKEKIQLLRPGEVARIFGISTPTLRKLEREGKITVYRTEKGQRRYNFYELLAFMKGEEHES